jgi:ATP-dependent helicase HrpA
MNLRLAQRDGKLLASSRELADLQSRFGADAERAFAASAGERLARAGLHEFPDTAIPRVLDGVAGVPAYPALADRGDSVALDVFADPAQAREEHARGLRRLARFALADAAKQARKQLPVSPKLGLLYAAIENSERLREDIVEAALQAVFDMALGDAGDTAGSDGIRDRAGFAAFLERARRELFAQAMQRLQLAEAILAAYAQTRPRLESELMGWASGNLGDIQAHLASLVHPGFLRDTPAALLGEFPRFLKAIALRLERAIADPVRDQARMLELSPFTGALGLAFAAHAARGTPLPAAWREFQRDLEELRVQVFAQELGTRRPVSAKRLSRQLDVLPLA